MVSSVGDSENASFEQVFKDEVKDKDGAPLEILGLQQQTARYMTPFDIICVGWNICNSWIGAVAVLSLIFYQGGSVTLLYGEVIIFVMYGCIIFTLGELASVYPTAGGQYHWTAILAPKSCSRALSYACGIVNVYSWIAIACGVVILLARAVLGVVIFYNSNYVPQPWHYFLVYQAINFLVILHNIFTLRRSMWIFNAGFALSLIAFFVIMITCLARAEKMQSTDFVWATFTNYTGWSSKTVVFLIGLVSPNYMYAGIDGAIHLAEECTNAATSVPRALMSTWLIGFVTSISFSVAMLYCIQDFTTVVSSPTGFPMYELWAQATRSDTAATIFLWAAIVAGTIALSGCEQTASRLTWSFARDNALLGSKWLAQMHKTLEAPVWALVANGFVNLIIGCIYLGSSTAFYAFISTGVILQLITFAFPAALLLIRGRSGRFLPSSRSFKLPYGLGWIANFFTVVFAIVGVVFYDFPTIMPVTSSNMNYTSAVLGAMAIFAMLNWFVWARTRYQGPSLEAK